MATLLPSLIQVYGYETYDFHQMLGNGSRRLKNHHHSVQNYRNFEIDETIVIEYNHSISGFKVVDTSRVNNQFIASSKNPLLINMPTGIFLWVPESYWAEQLKGKQQLALVITEVKCIDRTLSNILVREYNAIMVQKQRNVHSDRHVLEIALNSVVNPAIF